jgi:hypothetical protein
VGWDLPHGPLAPRIAACKACCCHAKVLLLLHAVHLQQKQ